MAIVKVTKTPAASGTPEAKPIVKPTAQPVVDDSGTKVGDSAIDAHNLHTGDTAPAPAAVVIGSTVVSHPDGSETETKEEVPVKAVIGAPQVSIGVSVGITRNLGNYESIKANVSINIPCAMDADEIEETYSQAKEWVDSKINEFNEEITNGLQ